jgi:hypothetical protein
MANYVLVLVLGLVAGSLGGIIGTGASIMLLPVLVFQFGPKQAVPIMAIAPAMSASCRPMRSPGSIPFTTPNGGFLIVPSYWVHAGCFCRHFGPRPRI